MLVETLYVPIKERPALRRIRRLSLPFEILFAALAMVDALVCLVVVWLVLLGASGGLHLRTGPAGGELFIGGDSAYAANSIDVSVLPLGARIIGLVITLGVLGSQFGAFYSLHRLFATYRRGIVFAEEPIRWMRRAGFLLVATGLAPLALRPLMIAAGLPDQRWFHSYGAAFVLIGAALFVLANIVALGREIEEEGEGYI